MNDTSVLYSELHLLKVKYVEKIKIAKIIHTLRIDRLPLVTRNKFV